MIELNINPIPAPRMVRSDKWKKRPIVERYFAYRNELKYLFNKHKIKLTGELNVTFVLPMPESWSKKKKLEMDGKPHQVRPDTDNIIKGYVDSFGVEDGYVYKLNVTKIWGTNGKIIIL